MCVYAGTPMGTKSSVNYPLGGISIPETQSHPVWGKVPGWVVPPREHFGGLRQSPGPRPGPASSCRRNKKDPARAWFPPGPGLAGCSRRHTDTGRCGTLPRTAIRWKCSLLGGEGAGKGKGKKALFFLLFFVSIWERLQAPSLKDHRRHVRAKMSSPHDAVNRWERWPPLAIATRVNGQRRASPCVQADKGHRGRPSGERSRRPCCRPSRSRRAGPSSRRAPRAAQGSGQRKIPLSPGCWGGRRPASLPGQSRLPRRWHYIIDQHRSPGCTGRGHRAHPAGAACSFPRWRCAPAPPCADRKGDATQPSGLGGVLAA